MVPVCYQILVIICCVYTKCKIYSPHFRPSSEKPFKSSITVKPNGVVHDFTWYPKMDISIPESNHFLACMASAPVHSFDATKGSLLGSYVVPTKHNGIAPIYSVSYNLSGNKIYCGLESKICVFETEYPGSDSECIDTNTSSHIFQNGIISSFAFNPVIRGMFAAGSYDKSVGIYDERQNGVLNSLAGHNGGITSLKFSSSGWYLFSGARKDDYIHCWDIRQQSILFSMKRCVDTQQRVLFDLDPYESKYLVTGSRNGVIFYELTKLGVDPIHVKMVNQMINSAQFHPIWPIVATASGERIFNLKESPDSDSESIQEEKVISEPNISLWKSNLWEMQSSENKEL
jgi:WD40 repeat protein